MGFTLFYARLMTCILRILFFSWFLSMVTMFYNFASFKQIWTTKYIRLVEVMIESDQGSRRKKINQLEKTIRGWEVKLSLGRLIKSLGRVSLGLLQRGVTVWIAEGNYIQGGGGGGFCEMCYFREFFRLKRCIRGGSLYFWDSFHFRGGGGEGRGLVLSRVITFEDSQLLCYVLQG